MCPLMLDVKRYSSSDMVTSCFVLLILFCMDVITYLGHSNSAFWICLITKGQKSSASGSELIRVQRSDSQPASYIRWMCEHSQSVHKVGCHASTYAEDIRVSCLDGGHATKTSHTPRLLCRDPWSDWPGWVLVAPATLYQGDGSRGSLTRVQGRWNDMRALRDSRLLLQYACLFLAHSPLKPPFCSPALSHSHSLSTFPVKRLCQSKRVPFTASWKVVWLSGIETPAACAMPFTGVRE